MAKQIRDIGASVRARLLALARHRNQQFDLVLTRYALERLLYRLSLTTHRERFVLKGAMLITTWFDDPHRPTRDVDLLGNTAILHRSRCSPCFGKSARSLLMTD